MPSDRRKRPSEPREGTVRSMLIAPTEPTVLKALGTSSSAPERWGVDFLWPTPSGLVGAQRKEWKDLLASVEDGRLQKEVAQMAELHAAWLIVEGQPRWTLDGAILHRYNRRWNRTAWRNLLRSVAAENIRVEHSDNLDDTAIVLKGLQEWTMTEHRTLKTRPKSASDGWGHREAKAWQSHLLQGMPGMGPTRAEAVINTFGRCPLAWTVTAKDLASVPGIGKKTATKLIELLEGGDEDRGVPHDDPDD